MLKRNMIIHEFPHGTMDERGSENETDPVTVSFRHLGERTPLSLVFSIAEKSM